MSDTPTSGAVGNALRGVPGVPKDNPHSERHRGRSLQPDAFSRRKWLIGGGITAAALAGAGLIREYFRERASVCILKDQAYDGRLVAEIKNALLAVGCLGAAWVVG